MEKSEYKIFGSRNYKKTEYYISKILNIWMITDFWNYIRNEDDLLLIWTWLFYQENIEISDIQIIFKDEVIKLWEIFNEKKYNAYKKLFIK